MSLRVQSWIWAESNGWWLLRWAAALCPVSWRRRLESSTDQFVLRFINYFVYFLFPDIDECLSIPNICRNGRCTNTIGSFQCICPDGYAVSANGRECQGKTFFSLISISFQAIFIAVVFPDYYWEWCECTMIDGFFNALSCFLISSSLDFCLDIREMSCYETYDAGRCSQPRPTAMTRAQCCCTKAAAWGNPCEVCPKPGESEYLDCISVKIRLTHAYMTEEMTYWLLFLFFPLILKIKWVYFAFTQWP